MPDIAAVTGGTGLIGSRIATRLVQAGFHVRVLTRRPRPVSGDVELVLGSLSEPEALNRLIRGARAVFHCAAEVRDVTRMEAVNVRGTQLVAQAARAVRVEYLCHLSSVGVIGRVSEAVVTEATLCRPENGYERTKLAGERLFGDGIDGGRVTILRPTNVVAEERIGVLGGVGARGARHRLRMFMVGGESAHLVHADDVADAALHRMRSPGPGVECFIVSTDHESGGSLGEIDALVRHGHRGMHLPPVAPFMIRRALNRRKNRGDVMYSSAALLSTGFRYQLGIRGTLERLIASGALGGPAADA